MEIEIKAKIKNIRVMKRKVRKLGARFVDKKHHVDIYYSLYRRPLKNKMGKVMRVRHDTINKNTRLEFHIPKNDFAAIELEVEVDDYKKLLAILKQMKAKQEHVVDKQRWTYRKGNVEIVLDKVKGLGNFIEVEIVGKDSKANRSKVLKILEQLKIDKEDYCHGMDSKYHAMIAKKKGKKYAYF